MQHGLYLHRAGQFFECRSDMLQRCGCSLGQAQRTALEIGEHFTQLVAVVCSSSC